MAPITTIDTPKLLASDLDSIVYYKLQRPAT
jgi:hypothetical protein